MAGGARPDDVGPRIVADEQHVVGVELLAEVGEELG
jgi:hypothetical protein